MSSPETSAASASRWTPQERFLRHRQSFPRVRADKHELDTFEVQRVVRALLYISARKAATQSQLRQLSRQLSSQGKDFQNPRSPLYTSAVGLVKAVGATATVDPAQELFREKLGRCAKAIEGHSRLHDQYEVVALGGQRDEEQLARLLERLANLCAVPLPTRDNIQPDATAEGEASDDGSVAEHNSSEVASTEEDEDEDEEEEEQAQAPTQPSSSITAPRPPVATQTASRPPPTKAEAKPTSSQPLPAPPHHPTAPIASRPSIAAKIAPQSSTVQAQPTSTQTPLRQPDSVPLVTAQSIPARPPPSPVVQRPTREPVGPIYNVQVNQVNVVNDQRTYNTYLNNSNSFAMADASTKESATYLSLQPGQSRAINAQQSQSSYPTKSDSARKRHAVTFCDTTGGEARAPGRDRGQSSADSSNGTGTSRRSRESQRSSSEDVDDATGLVSTEAGRHDCKRPEASERPSHNKKHADDYMRGQAPYAYQSQPVYRSGEQTYPTRAKPAHQPRKLDRQDSEKTKERRRDPPIGRDAGSSGNDNRHRSKKTEPQTQRPSPSGVIRDSDLPNGNAPGTNLGASAQWFWSAALGAWYFHDTQANQYVLQDGRRIGLAELPGGGDARLQEVAPQTSWPAADRGQQARGNVQYPPYEQGTMPSSGYTGPPFPASPQVNQKARDRSAATPSAPAVNARSSGELASDGSGSDSADDDDPVRRRRHVRSGITRARDSESDSTDQHDVAARSSLYARDQSPVHQPRAKRHGSSKQPHHTRSFSQAAAGSSSTQGSSSAHSSTTADIPSHSSLVAQGFDAREASAIMNLVQRGRSLASAQTVVGLVRQGHASEVAGRVADMVDAGWVLADAVEYVERQAGVAGQGRGGNW